MSLLFSSYTLNSPKGPLELANRIVVAPMCQYSANNGEATDWHLMHWGNLLNSGAALFIIEATGVSPEARITPACLGLWDDRTESALKDKLGRARELAPAVPVFIQLAHAGRKASSATPWDGGQLLSIDQGGWETLAPSAIPQLDGERLPHELSKTELKKLIDDFVSSAKRAARSGIDGIELHGAHGYLLHQFLSPIANQRTDEYGGSFENRIRFPLELFAAVRAAYQGVLGIRISACDWIEGGWTPEETANFAKQLKPMGCDFVHISSGGISPKQKIAIGPNYQVSFAKIVKEQSGLPTMTVGLITEPQQAEDILQAGDADLIALARAFLYKPRWGWEAAAALGGTVTANERYWRCLPREAQAVFGDVKVGQR
ncbi:NADH:flavin oxidoreductase/NADH oxidase [Polynucleobacter sp. AP-Reno-20A-A9]|uniref:NADH:flavin oxidoreductase/NADH oxidase n=1 Tax=Polynucleobacter sp. AP-Reno-20A-A9 TaxID=2576925 RepID=UPI001C0CE4A2|nr:NADH:flavin oxidoreductase/NADH oxidase [Polynucleobacter sp. AP-Reno-20A-A9]MBU3628343.1 NADH:flavin oxidoreductase/NADH oxidase [Polynucleobacter sp. AP-Reno-20A-A9]